MTEDSLMREIRAAKDAYARSFNYDIRAIAADLQALEKSGDWPVVRLSPRRPAGYIAPGAQPEPVPQGADRPVPAGEAVAPRECPEDQQRSSPGPRRVMSSRCETDTPSRIELGDTVALKLDLPASGLTAGEVGVVVEIFGEAEAFEVKFCDNSGANYGLHTLRPDQLIALHSRGQALRLRVESA